MKTKAQLIKDGKQIIAQITKLEKIGQQFRQGKVSRERYFKADDKRLDLLEKLGSIKADLRKHGVPLGKVKSLLGDR